MEPDHKAYTKISPGFVARLDRLDPADMVRAILLLHTDAAPKGSGRRQSFQERQAVIEVTRRSAAESLDEIDAILLRFGGRRQGAAPDVLGSIPVETTPAGISALAASDRVRAIFEDQLIRAGELSYP